MNCQHKLPLFLGAGILAFACSLPFGAAQTAVQNTASRGVESVAPAATSANPPSGPRDTSVAGLMKSFPIPPNSKMVSSSADSGEPGAATGSFVISSAADIPAVESFYATELPKQGWTLRYTDPNTSCGVTQYWKNDAVYLTLAFRYETPALTINGQYRRVDAQSIKKYLPDFPLPETTELVDSSATSWEYYILQSSQAVEAFYQQQLSSPEWTLNGIPEPVQASCGEVDPEGCEGGGSGCPAGVNPMPSPTLDSRQAITLLYTLPDKNEVQLEIVPHGSATILFVDVTLKGIESSGLPKDLPVYPGAVVLIVAPGTVEYQVEASLEAVKQFYEKEMRAAGWSPDGNAFENPGSYMQNWMKADQKVGLTIISDGHSTTIIFDCSACR